MGVESVFSKHERAAWCAPERLTPTQWAERYRVLLPSSGCAEPGPLRISRTPYLQEILDSFIDPNIEEIIGLKSVQVGWSELIRSQIGFAIDSEPGPALLVMPNQRSARDLVNEQIRPLIEETPVLQRHLTSNKHDNTKGGIRLDSMSLHIGWAGSPQSLASRPIRYAFLDEVDKAAAFSGREADHISLTIRRTETYLHRKKIVIGSTPTTRRGHIWRAWEGCSDKRYYHVPCPHCRFYQPLSWTQTKYPKIVNADQNKLADEVRNKRLAHYECIKCKHEILDRHKPKMLADGIWLSEGQMFEDGRVIGARTRSKRVGYHINALYSPWKSFSDIAAEGIRAQGDDSKQMDFRNSCLGEVHEQQLTTIKVGTLRDRLKDSPKPDLVPKWAGALITSVDVHIEINGYYWVIRAWGKDFKSQLIHIGVSYDLNEVLKLGLDTPIPMEGGTSVYPQILVIDAGFRTDEIYQLAARDSRIHPVKGTTQDAPIKVSDAAKDVGAILRTINSEYYKDRLASLRKDPEKWLLNSEVTDQYLHHQAAEHKILTSGKKRVYKWEKVSTHAENHFFDAECYNLVGADIIHASLIPTEAELVAMREMERQQAEQIASRPEKKKQGWIGNTENWLSGVKN